MARLGLSTNEINYLKDCIQKQQTVNRSVENLERSIRKIMDDIVALREDCDSQNSQLLRLKLRNKASQSKTKLIFKMHESIRKFILAFKDKYSGFIQVACWLNRDKHSGDPDVEVQIS